MKIDKDTVIELIKSKLGEHKAADADRELPGGLGKKLDDLL